jgi:hypothetical protein
VPSGSHLLLRGTPSHLVVNKCSDRAESRWPRRPHQQTVAVLWSQLDFAS